MNDRIKKDTHLLIVVLFDEAYLEEISLGLTSVSGGRVTMVDAVSGTENLSQAIPMFAEFFGLKGKQICKILFTEVPFQNPAKRLIKVLNEANLDFVGLGIGEIYVIKLTEAVVFD